MTGKRPARPSLSTSREPLLVPGLPAPAPTPAPAVPVQPAPYPGVRGYGQPPVRAVGRRTGTRPDPPGMSRESYYVTEAAAAAVAAAIEQVRQILGGDVKKHVILSALLQAAAERAGDVAEQLAAEQASQLASRLDALRRTPD